MDRQRTVLFIRAIRRVPSRRDVLRSLAGTGLGLSFAQFPNLNHNLDPVAAKKRKRKKRKKRKNKKNKRPQPPRRNEYGCFEVGDPCTSAADCCSSICESGTCRAHDTGVCRQDKPGVCTAPLNDIPMLSCGPSCWCYRTTAGSNFCGPGPRTSGQEDCTDCKTDADCLALGYPAGSACAPLAGTCNGWCDSGMACLVPCGVEYPEPIA